MLKIQDTINRSFNLLAVAIVGLSGFAFMPEIFLEKDWDDKLDDIGLLILGIAAIWWYMSKGNKYRRSLTPVIFSALALMIKIAAVAIEFHDAESVGDDFGAMILFILALGLCIYQYKTTKKLLAMAA